MFVQHYAPYMTFDFKNGNANSHCQIFLLVRSRSQSQINCMMVKVLPQERHIPAVKAPDLTMQKLYSRLIFFQVFCLVGQRSRSLGYKCPLSQKSLLRGSYMPNIRDVPSVLHEINV